MRNCLLLVVIAGFLFVGCARGGMEGVINKEGGSLRNTPEMHGSIIGFSREDILASYGEPEVIYFSESRMASIWFYNFGYVSFDAENRVVKHNIAN